MWVTGSQPFNSRLYNYVADCCKGYLVNDNFTQEAEAAVVLSEPEKLRLEQLLAQDDDNTVEASS